MCYCCRPGSLRADAFRGHGLSLLEKTTLRGLRTRAIPAGVTALHSPGLVKLFTENFLCHFIQLNICVIGKCYTSSPYTCPFIGVCRRWAQSPSLVGLPYL